MESCVVCIWNYVKLPKKVCTTISEFQTKVWKSPKRMRLTLVKRNLLCPNANHTRINVLLTDHSLNFTWTYRKKRGMVWVYPCHFCKMTFPPICKLQKATCKLQEETCSLWLAKNYEKKKISHVFASGLQIARSNLQFANHYLLSVNTICKQKVILQK